MKHAIAIYWSNEDNAFIAVAPELNGCMTHGDTYAEALSMMLEVMPQWIEFAKENGQYVPKPKGKKAFSIL